MKSPIYALPPSAHLNGQYKPQSLQQLVGCMSTPDTKDVVFVTPNGSFRQDRPWLPALRNFTNDPTKVTYAALKTLEAAAAHIVDQQQLKQVEIWSRSVERLAENTEISDTDRERFSVIGAQAAWLAWSQSPLTPPAVQAEVLDSMAENATRFYYRHIKPLPGNGQSIPAVFRPLADLGRYSELKEQWKDSLQNLSDLKRLTGSQEAFDPTRRLILQIMGIMASSNPLPSGDLQADIYIEKGRLQRLLDSTPSDHPQYKQYQQVQESFTSLTRSITNNTHSPDLYQYKNYILYVTNFAQWLVENGAPATKKTELLEEAWTLRGLPFTYSTEYTSLCKNLAALFETSKDSKKLQVFLETEMTKTFVDFLVQFNLAREDRCDPLSYGLNSGEERQLEKKLQDKFKKNGGLIQHFEMLERLMETHASDHLQLMLMSAMVKEVRYFAAGSAEGQGVSAKEDVLKAFRAARSSSSLIAKYALYAAAKRLNFDQDRVNRYFTAYEVARDRAHCDPFITDDAYFIWQNDRYNWLYYKPGTKEAEIFKR